LPEVLAEVGHRLDVADGAAVHPLHELARTERLLAHPGDERLQLGPRQAEQVGLRCGELTHDRL